MGRVESWPTYALTDTNGNFKGREFRVTSDYADFTGSPAFAATISGDSSPLKAESTNGAGCDATTLLGLADPQADVYFGTFQNTAGTRCLQ